MPRRTAFALAVGLVFAATSARAQDGARRDEAKPAPAPEPVLTKPPVLLEGVAPIYPDAALAAKLGAEVPVQIDIDATGAVTDARVLTPVGNGFDEAAIAAARQYRFEPAELDGVPAPITVETTIHFVIAEVEDEPLPPAGAQAAPRSDTGPASHAGDMRRPISIEGVAVERGTRRLLPGVVVSVVELGLDAITDDAGRFFARGLPPGRFTLVALEPGYDRFTRTVDLAAGEKLELRLYLRPKGGNPYETVVEGEAAALEVTKRTLQRRQLTTVPGTFGDPIRVVQALPGLARTPFITGFLLIRGSFPGDSGIYVDGHQVPLLFHFLGGPSFLNPEFLDQIELYPGGFPARFGRATGGIVAVETRAPASDGWHGQADVDLLDAGAYLRVPLGQHSGLAIAGRRSYLNLLLPAFLPEDAGETLVVTPIYQDYNLRYDHDLGRHGALSLFLFGSSDELDVLSADEDEEDSFALDSAIRFFRVIATYRRPLIGELALTLSSAIGRDSVLFSGGQFESASPETEIDIAQDTLSYRMRLDGLVADRVRLDAGVEVASRITRYELLVPIDDDVRVLGDVDIPNELLRRSIEGLDVSVHADVAWDVGHGVRLIPGLRASWFSLAAEDRFAIDPRLVARWQLDEQWTPKAYIGLFTQPPQPETLDDRFGNPGLDLEYAVHTGVGAEFRPSPAWSFDAETYYIDRNRQVQFTEDARVRDDGTVEPQNFLNSGAGFTYGLELLIKKQVTKQSFGWLSYTLSRSEYRDEPDDDYEPSVFDQTHVLNAVYSYTTDNGWELGARFRLATGEPRTPVVGSTFDADTGGYVPVLGDARSVRDPVFHQLDLRVEKTWQFRQWSLGVYLDVLNALNADNEEATQYDYRYRDTAPVMGVPIVPTVGVRGRF
jgi:TonB family protein